MTEAVGVLLDVEGMKCGSCVRSVEQRLQQQPGVRQASVSLLTRTAWVELEGGEKRLEPLRAVCGAWDSRAS